MKTIYVTDDGKEFADQDEAKRWESALGMEGAVRMYLNQQNPELTPKAITQRANIILAWERDREDVLMAEGPVKSVA